MFKFISLLCFYFWCVFFRQNTDQDWIKLRKNNLVICFSYSSQRNWTVQKYNLHNTVLQVSIIIFLMINYLRGYAIQVPCDIASKFLSKILHFHPKYTFNNLMILKRSMKWIRHFDWVQLSGKRHRHTKSFHKFYWCNNVT